MNTQDSQDHNTTPASIKPLPGEDIRTTAQANRSGGVFNPARLCLHQQEVS